jgi:hypothetical protein
LSLIDTTTTETTDHLFHLSLFHALKGSLVGGKDFHLTLFLTISVMDYRVLSAIIQISIPVMIRHTLLANLIIC